MSTLVLDLSEQQSAILEQVAKQRGMTLQAFVLATLDTIALNEQPTFDYTTDPLYTIKSHATHAPADLSERSDWYLYGDTSL